MVQVLAVQVASPARRRWSSRAVHLVYIGSTGQIMHTSERADGTWTYPDQVASGSAYKQDKFASVSAASVGGLLQIAVVDQARGTVLHTGRHADGPGRRGATFCRRQASRATGACLSV